MNTTDEDLKIMQLMDDAIEKITFERIFRVGVIRPVGVRIDLNLDQPKITIEELMEKTARTARTGHLTAVRGIVIIDDETKSI